MSADGLLDGAQVDAFEVPIASQGVTTEVRDRAMRAARTPDRNATGGIPHDKAENARDGNPSSLSGMLARRDQAMKDEA